MFGGQPQLERLIAQLRPCSIAVIGDVMLDRYARGRVDRLSPEAPIQVLEVESEDQMPGGAANVAMKVVGLDSRVRLVGLVGDDQAGTDLRQLITSDPLVADGLVADPDRATTLKTRFIAHGQQLLRVDHERRVAPSGLVEARLARAAREAAASADAVILEDYGKGVLTPAVIKAALEGAAVRGIPVVVDPNGRDYRRYAGATVLTPNLKEAATAAEMPIRTPDDLEAAARLLVGQTGSALAITRESEGISLFRNQGGSLRHDHVPTSPVAVFDVTGAGDAVAATLAIALANGVPMTDACALANLAGRAVVRQLGVGRISVQGLHAEAAEISGQATMSKVVALDEAKRRAADVRRHGGRVVFTNGCFDLLHYGHAFLLQYARSRGDMLILGLNTDASVRRQKGPHRPIVPEDQRSYMLSLYPFVDLVVLFDDDTPMNLIEALHPEVLVKGGDYTPATVVGREFVESYGGQILICPRLEGHSTTGLVQKIQAA